MILVIGLLLDAALGEPKPIWDRIPHPAVLMGRAIGWADRRFNTGAHRKAKGIALAAALVLGGWLLGTVLAALPGAVVEVLALAALLAQRSLVDHVADVARALRRSLAEGRTAVARIVGRDVSAMTEPEVARAAIESGAENFSDGVVAPAFWFAVAGLPGLLIYKLVNTADSMVGYRTPRHEAFGWASARLDDLLNLIPARLSALLLWAVANRPEPAGILADAPRHRSPNAGWPEAAMAYGLGLALSGPRSYEGQRRDFPFVNPHGRRDIGPAEIEHSVTALWRAWALMALLIAAAALF